MVRQGGPPGRRLVIPGLIALTILAVVLACSSPSASSSATSPPQASAGENPTPTSEPESQTWDGYLASLASALRISSPPKVEPLRTVAPEDRRALINACLTDSGFATDEYGKSEFPTDQLEAFNLTMYTCEARYPMDEKFLQPFTDKQVRQIHAYLLESAVPCLATLGYDVPAPPSEDTFAATFDTADGYSLSRELLNLGVSETTLSDVLAQCPEFPNSADLYQN